VLKVIENWNGGWEVKLSGNIMEGVVLTKIKYTHRGIYRETPLNINLNVNNER
jgi:hypothetical protein